MDQHLEIKQEMAGNSTDSRMLKAQHERRKHCCLLLCLCPLLLPMMTLIQVFLANLPCPYSSSLDLSAQNFFFWQKLKLAKTSILPKYATELATKILMFTLVDIVYSEAVPHFMQQMS